MKKIKIDNNCAGKRLDLFVAENLPERSRSLAGYLIENGFVKINGFMVKKGYVLKNEDILDLNFEETDLSRVLPDENVDFDVALEKEGYIIAIKKEGIKTHPLVPFEKGTLLNGIVSRFPSAGKLYAKRYEGGLIHRLDTDTSGLILCALNQGYFKRFKEAFKHRSVKKHYYAVIEGTIKKGGAISAKIVSPFKGAGRVHVDPSDEDPEYATYFNPLRSNKKYTLLDIELIGGKMHQIRAHLSWLGFPIVGDKIYNKNRTYKGRMMLHSYRLALEGEFDVSCDMPPEFKDIIG